MMADANSLTGRANPAPAAGPMPTVASREFRVLVDALAAIGYDTLALLSAIGVDPASVQDLDGRVRCDAYGALIAHAQQSRYTPNLALKVATHVPIGAFPLLDYLVLTASTVGEGVRRLARYFSLLASPMRIEFEDTVDPCRVAFEGADPPFFAEYSVALAVLHFTEETDGAFRAVDTHLRHQPDDGVEFARVLRCPVHARASWDGIRVSAAVWQLPLRRRDPILHALLERQADGAVGEAPAGGLAGEVRRMLRSQLSRGDDPRIDVVARELATSSRTLQRRLAAEGSSFQQEVEDVRRDAAGRYLTDRTLAIAEVAYLLGYSEPAPFHRAFKRWYGVTPEAFRKSKSAPKDRVTLV